ncbi:hypothetical protein D3C71_1036690 [compost metagenome]
MNQQYVGIPFIRSACFRASRHQCHLPVPRPTALFTPAQGGVFNQDMSAEVHDKQMVLQWRQSYAGGSSRMPVVLNNRTARNLVAY